MGNLNCASKIEKQIEMKTNVLDRLCETSTRSEQDINNIIDDIRFLLDLQVTLNTLTLGDTILVSALVCVTIIYLFK